MAMLLFYDLLEDGGVKKKRKGMLSIECFRYQTNLLDVLIALKTIPQHNQGQDSVFKATWIPDKYVRG